MGRTANFRRQHDVAIDMVSEIAALGDRLGEPGMPYRLGLKLAKLTGMLRIHFVQEDETLYPHMIASTHPQAAATAARFQREMGGLGEAYESFAARWSSASALTADPAAYRAESRKIFAALAARIARENDMLYPLADAIEDWKVARRA